MTAPVLLLGALLAPSLLGCKGSEEPGPIPGDTSCGALAMIRSKCAMSDCHSASSKRGDLDLESPDPGPRLVGVVPDGLNDSKCAGQGAYLVAGSNPAAGLFFDKLAITPPCGDRMPNRGVYLSANQVACLQEWATMQTAP
jgi:hypothetical protein